MKTKTKQGINPLLKSQTIKIRTLGEGDKLAIKHEGIDQSDGSFFGPLFIRRKNGQIEAYAEGEHGFARWMGYRDAKNIAKVHRVELEIV